MRFILAPSFFPASAEESLLAQLTGAQPAGATTTRFFYRDVEADPEFQLDPGSGLAAPRRFRIPWFLQLTDSGVLLRTGIEAQAGRARRAAQKNQVQMR